MPSAVIVRARLPGGLERLRRELVRDAADGVPAHLTLLYPFVEANDLTPAIRGRLRAVAERHAPFEYSLQGRAEWPGTTYVSVRPVAPFVRLQRDLQDAFPDYPIYGADAPPEYVPHITVAEGPDLDSRSIAADPAWRALPRPARAVALAVIATGEDGRWRVAWRIRLGGGPPVGPSAAARGQGRR